MSALRFSSLRSAIVGLVAVLGAVPSCSSQSDRVTLTKGSHSSSMALSADGNTLFIANPESDSVSILDLKARTLEAEILLAANPPAVDGSGNFAPAVMPRAVALSRDGKTLYVSGERSGSVHAIDVASRSVRASVHVGSEPVGVLVSSDGKFIFVAASADDAVIKVDAASMKVAASLAVDDEPWALASSPDATKLVVTHLLTGTISEIDPSAMSGSAAKIPDVAPRGDRRLAHGQPRGFYDAAARPGSNELWTSHALLGTDTAQPDLDFESTAFPALSILSNDTYQATISDDAQDVDGIDGAFADITSGPHAIGFTHDGKIVLMADANSGDVMAVDASTRKEIDLLRPLPGKMPDGIVLSSDDTHAYIDERVSGDVAVMKIDRSSGALALSIDGDPIPRTKSDPMPANLRLGQYLFNLADSGVYPITTNHWIACATCHLEERSDAVTWKFTQGPRDTPSNAGGMIGTGFLFRTADRTTVRDYWHTINTEQGGHFDPNDPSLSALLDALTAYVNYAIPLPIPPTTDPTLVKKGESVFQSEGCGDCHAGPRFTDSGSLNPTLDLNGTIVLHDVGTCNTGDFPDVDHEDVDGGARAACAFDTPSLNGVSSSPPYLHDGTASTLRDAVDAMVLKQGKPALSQEDEDALVEYLKSL